MRGLSGAGSASPLATEPWSFRELSTSATSLSHRLAIRRKAPSFIPESMTKDNAQEGDFTMTNPNRSAVALVAVVLLCAVAAGVARADFLKGDPRKCWLNKPDSCAHASAVMVLRTALQKKYALPYLYQGPTSCKQAATTSLFRWSCTYGAGTATVLFRATSTGWKRQVTVT